MRHDGRSLLAALALGLAASLGLGAEKLAWQDSGPWRLTERPAPSPRRQLALARSVEERGNFRLAEAQYARLVRHYPDAPEAGNASVGIARSAFLDGRADEAVDQLWGAVRRYPDEARAADAVELACAIGKIMMDRVVSEKQAKGFPLLKQASGIFERVLRLDPAGTAADDALYFLGLARELMGDTGKAAESYARLLTRFPGSVHCEEAKARLRGLGAAGALAKPVTGGGAEARTAVPGAAGADVAAADEASATDDREAAKTYRRGLYYIRIGKVKAARVYMGLVVTRHAATRWARLAEDELKRLPKAGDGGER